MYQFLSLLFNAVWDLFMIPWPGFDFPIVYAFLGVAFAAISLKLLLSLFNVSLGSSISSFVRSSNNRNIHIAESRKGDEK